MSAHPASTSREGFQVRDSSAEAAVWIVYRLWLCLFFCPLCSASVGWFRLIVLALVSRRLDLSRDFRLYRGALIYLETFDCIEAP